MASEQNGVEALSERPHGNGVHIFFYRQLNFQFEPGSCLAIFENGLKTELTLPAKTYLNDSS